MSLIFGIMKNMKWQLGSSARIRAKATLHSTRARLVRLVGRRSRRLQSYACTDFTRDELISLKRPSVSVCVLTKNCSDTIKATVTSLMAVKQAGLVDEVVVVDANSPDGTAQLAARFGATVYLESDLLPELGPVLGKGDAMWRAQSVMSGEIFVYQDGDLADYAERHLLGVLGPLLVAPSISFVKGTYQRHLRMGKVTVQNAGGRVSQLTARPLLKALYPDLAQFRQPLSGECAIRRSLARSIPFVTGYGVETGMLIDTYRAVGIHSMAEVDLLERSNNHQDLDALSKMAEQVIATVLERSGMLPSDAESLSAVPERPPFEDFAEELASATRSFVTVQTN
jgi:glucosyl-3-phosphoglycerate synthase